MLDNMLRDCLVCGIRQLSIQRRLLAEPTLTLKCAFQLILAMESEEKDIRDIQRADVSSTQTQVHKVDKKTQHQVADLKTHVCLGCNK